MGEGPGLSLESCFPLSWLLNCWVPPRQVLLTSVQISPHFTPPFQVSSEGMGDLKSTWEETGRRAHRRKQTALPPPLTILKTSPRTPCLFLLFLFAHLRVEPRALGMLGKHPASELYLPGLAAISSLCVLLDFVKQLVKLWPPMHTPKETRQGPGRIPVTHTTGIDQTRNQPGFFNIGPWVIWSHHLASQTWFF